MLLVTGISGLTGKFLYEEIKKSFGNEEIKYFVRKTSNISWMEKDERVAYGDIKDFKSVNDAFQGYYCITFSSVVN